MIPSMLSAVPPSPPSDADLVQALCRFIDGQETLPPLAELAAHIGRSPSATERLFKRVLGVTPRAWADERRAQRLRGALDGGARVTDALYDAGYGSSSRLYEKSDAVLGMKPTRYRDGAPGERITFSLGPCSLGEVLVASTTRGVCSICLGDDPDVLLEELQRRFPKAELVGGDARHEATVAAVIDLVERPDAPFELPLDVRGTAFQRRVWEALRKIPAGTTMSYAELAARVGRPKATRAVASACGANTIAVAIPCHRVVRKDGSLSGYRWGIERKATLLEREQQAADASRDGQS
jgi:AraC family transcriptional regulator of adaptative response/methylated-DNA-[protein]-cysteine methyltransferase